MMKIRLFAVLLLCLGINYSIAGSIFSGGGLGLINHSQGGRAAGMGILGISLFDTTSVGSANPALWALIPVTKFSGGMSVSRFDSRDTGGNDVSDDFLLQHAALGISLKKNLTIGFKFFPQSRIDYRTFDRSATVSGLDYEAFNIGKGGVSTASLVASSKLTKNSFIGAEIDFIFGNLNTLWGANFTSTSISDVQYTLNKRIYGIRPKLGFSIDLGNRQYFGLYAAASADMDAEQEIDYTATDSTWVADIEFSYPASFGLGYSFPVSGRVQSEIDFLWTGWKREGQEIGESNRYQQSQFFGIGFEVQPLSGTMLPFYQKLHYRTGVNYQSLYYQSPAGESVSDYSFSFGLGIPLKQQFSRMDVSLTAGKRGNLDDNYAEETYYNIGVYFSTGEKWFVRKKRY